MSLTTVPVGDPTAISKQSAGLFLSRIQAPNGFNKLSGPMPKFNEALRGIKQQTSASYPVVRCTELTKDAGDEIKVDLAIPVTGYPTMGDRALEGNGKRMNTKTMSMRIDQTRFAVNAGGAMSQQRTIYDLRQRAMAEGYAHMKRSCDQRLSVHLAGARGHLDHSLWNVPLSTHAEFADIMVNTVKAPTRNRHLVADATNGLDDAYGAMSGTLFASGDEMTFATIDALRAYVDGLPMPPNPVIIPGDTGSDEKPLYILCVSPAQYENIKTDSTQFRTFQANAHARAVASRHPIFTGEVGLWNNILVRQMPWPIRFLTNGAVKYCASYTTETESDYTATFNFDRALLLGGQAVIEAFGGYKTLGKSGPEMFNVSEEKMDHGNVVEIAYGEMSGIAKARWQFDQGDGNGNAYTDLNVIAIDTAVTLI